MDPARRGNSKLIPVAIIAAALIVGGAVVIAYRGSGEEGPEMPSNSAKKADGVRPVGADDWILGDPDAAIVMVEYSDFECPFCRQFHQTLHRIIDEHGKQSEVAWVFRHFPIAQLHKKAATEALAAECAGLLGGNDAFWKYADLIFASGKGNDTLDLSILPSFAESIGLNRAQFDTCMSTKSLMSEVEADFENAVLSGGAGTPFTVLIVDGKHYPIAGAQQYPAMKAVIQSILTHRGASAITSPTDTLPEDVSPSLP